MAKSAKEIRASKGMVNVKYLKDLGTNEKGLETVMHSSTAEALVTKEFVKILSKVEEYKPAKAQN